MTKNTAPKARKAATPVPTNKPETIFGADVSGPETVVVALQPDMNDAGFRFEVVDLDALKAQ